MVNFHDIKVLQKVHNAALLNYERQKAIDISTIVYCALLVLPSLFVLIRVIMKHKSNFYLLSMIILLFVGELSGIASSVLVWQLFDTASVWKDLLNADPNKLQAIFNGYAWTLSIFLTSFSLTHWIFAV